MDNRKVLRKRVFRSLKSGLLRNLSLFLLMVLMISATSGFLVTADSIADLEYKLHKKGKVEDGQFTAAFPLSDQSLDKLESLGIELENFGRMEVKIKKEKTIRLYGNRKEINLPILNQGKLATKENEIALNRLYARNNHINIGDTLSLDGEYFSDGKSRKLKVVGFFVVPDYTACFSKNSDLIFNAINFGVGLVSQELAEKFSGEKLMHQYSYRFTELKSSNEDKILKLNHDIIKSASKESPIISYIFKKDNNGINYILNDMGGDRPMMISLMGLMILIIAFMFGVSIAGKIRAESEIIGILMASGYSKSELLRNYISSPLLITLAAALVGNLIGYTLYVNPFSNMYYRSFDLPNFIAKFNVEAFIITTIIPIAVILAFNFFFINSKLKHKPLEFMRKEFTKKEKKGIVKKRENSKGNRKESLPSINAFMKKFQLRVFLANKGDYIISVIGIFIISILVNFALSAEPTFENYSDELGKNLISNYQYILKAPVEVDAEAVKAEKYTLAPCTAYHKLRGADDDVSFIGVSSKSKFFKGVKLPSKKDEVIISQNMALKFRLKVGDSIKIKSDILDKSKTVKIVDSYNYSGGFALFTRQDFVNEFMEKDKEFFNGYYSNDKLSINGNYVATIIDKNSITDVAEQLESSMGPVLDVFILVAIVFLIAFMYVLTKIIMEKNQIQIAYLKIFGYKPREINKIYMRPFTIILLLTLILEIPLVYSLTKELTYLSTLKFSGYFDFITPPSVVAKIFIIAFAVYGSVYLIQLYKISKMSFSEALKSRE